MELPRSLTVDKTWKLCISASICVALSFIFIFSISRNYNNLIGNYSSFARNTSSRMEEEGMIILLSNTTADVLQLEANQSSEVTGRVENKPALTTMTTGYLNFTSEEEGKEDVEKKTCDMYEGKWVFNPNQKSAYDEERCPFIEEKMSCKRNKRPDLDFSKWSWEASNCSIPMFNGREILERLRGKRVILVGDSLNRNQWESLACLLYASIHRKSRIFVDSNYPEYKIFKAKDYNCVVEFYWSPFIVDHEELNHPSGSRVVTLDKLPHSSKKWKGADVMIFNTGHWWTHHGKLKSWDFFEYKKKLVEEMPIELAYETALKTWSTWIDDNVNPNKTTVFFRSISSEHRKNWCFNVTQPMMDESSYIQSFPTSLMQIVKDQIKKTRFPVRYMNITKLSQNRIDAHPSIYRTSDNWKLMSNITDEYEYDKFVKEHSDCSHWCLPGVPDTWNRLLFASLFFNFSSAY